jgi:hypothetical protein
MLTHLRARKGTDSVPQACGPTAQVQASISYKRPKPLELRHGSMKVRPTMVATGSEVIPALKAMPRWRGRKDGSSAARIMLTGS